METMHGGEHTNPTDRRLIGRIGLWVAVFAVLAFLPALACDFVNFDDNQNFHLNHALDYPLSRKLAWAWMTRLVHVYQPLAWMLIIAEHAIWALKPMGYHAVSLLLHGAVATALFAPHNGFAQAGDAPGHGTGRTLRGDRRRYGDDPFLRSSLEGRGCRLVVGSTLSPQHPVHDRGRVGLSEG